MSDSFISNYITYAIKLAQRGRGFVNPNPLVGAVIVKGGKIIGEGWHKKYGGLHAEREAIADAKRRGNSCRGADIYVTLEPCCHTGKQPPCTDAIIAEGFARVFVGSNDPNPLVSGKGFEILRKAGIEVYTECLKAECDAINKTFFHYITTKTPYITMKYAVTADGVTSCATGDSKWISCEKSRELVQKERACNMAVMTGINTVLADDPMLNCRLSAKDCGFEGSEVRQPVRIVCDSNLQIPLDCKLVATAKEVPLIVACALSGGEIEKNCKAIELRSRGVEIITTSDTSIKNEKVNLKRLVNILGERGIDSVLLESGGILNGAALKAGIVNKIQVFIAPKIVGSVCIADILSGGKPSDVSVTGAKIFSPVRQVIAEHPAQAIVLGSPKVSLIENDVLLEYEVKN